MGLKTPKGKVPKGEQPYADNIDAILRKALYGAFRDMAGDGATLNE